MNVFFSANNFVVLHIRSLTRNIDKIDNIYEGVALGVSPGVKIVAC